MKKKGLSAAKAKQILKDGYVKGKSLTEKQKKFFGSIADGATPLKKINGGWLDKYQDGGKVKAQNGVNKINYQPEELINLQDYTITPQELKFLNENKDEYCPSGNCLQSSRTAFNKTAGTITGVPDMYNIWENDLGVTSTKHEPTPEMIDKYPWFKGDTETGSADSWDIQGNIIKSGGKTLYNINDENSTYIPGESPIGSIYSFGPLDKKDSEYANRNQGYNKDFGLQPSHHSAIVVGFDQDSQENILYDSYYKTYFKESELVEKMKSGLLNYELEAIGAPKSILHLTRENLKDSKNLYNKKKYTPFNVDLNTLEQSTKDKQVQIKEDGEYRSPRFNKETMAEFTSSLTDNKKLLMEEAGISNEEYDELANMAIAIAMAESEGGEALMLDALGDTQGLTQLNWDNIKDDKELFKILEKVNSRIPGTGKLKNISDLRNPKKSAIATMLYLSKGKDLSKKLFNEGKNPGVRNFYDNSSWTETFRSSSAKINKDGFYIDKLKKRVDFDDIPGWDDKDIEQVTKSLNEISGTSNYEAKLTEDGDIYISMKTEGNNPDMSTAKRLGYWWQSPNSLKTGDAQGDNVHASRIEHYYNTLSKNKKDDQVTGNMKNGGWLSKYQDGGSVQPNYNDSNVSLPPGFEGYGYDKGGRAYNGAWDGPVTRMGGTIPGATGMMYARTSGTSPEEPKKAQDGTVMYGTPEYEAAYREGRFADVPNVLDEVVITSGVDYNQYPLYDKLSAQQKEYFNDPGPIGRGVRRAAQTDRGLAEDTYDVVNPIMYGALGVAGGMVAGPSITTLGRAAAPYVSRYALSPIQKALNYKPLGGPVSVGNVVDAGSAAYAAYATPEAYDKFKENPSFDTGTDLALTAIDLVPLGEIFTGFKGTRNLYNKGKNLLTNDLKPNPNMYYRGIGQSGLDDALQSGLLRAKPADQIAPAMVGSFDIAKRFNNLYVTPKLGVAQSYGKGVVAEVPRDVARFSRRYKRSDWSMMTNNQIPIEQVNFYKKNFFGNYKPIDIPSSSLSDMPWIQPNIYPTSSPLPKNMEPYLSKRVYPFNKEQEIFESFLPIEAQLKNIDLKSIRYDADGNIIPNMEYGGEIDEAQWGKILKAAKNLYSGFRNADNVIDAANTVRKTSNVVDNAWAVKPLPGLHLRSTMENGPISKIIQPKTGLINTEQALAIIGKESGGADKVALIRQALGDNIPMHIDYNDFRKVVQDQLIPLERQVGQTGGSGYGLNAIGYNSNKRDFSLAKKELEDLLNGKITDVGKLSRSTKSVITSEGNTAILHPDFIKGIREESYISAKDLIEKLKINPEIQKILKSNYIHPIENQTIILGNKNKFGRGSSAHGNPDETLGHIHFFRDAETPNTLTVTQIQSDAFQGPHRVMPDKNETQKWEKMLTLEGRKELVELGGEEAADLAQESARGFLEQATKKAEEALGPNPTQKQLLDKNHQERYLQELLNYAGQRGDVSTLRLPTSETAAKVQGYKRVSTTGDDGTVYNNYSPQDQTILKKYSQQPKTIKKLFGVEPTIVTDSKNNTWYEFNIPESFKSGTGEIQAFKDGGWLDKFQEGGVIEDDRGQWAYPGEITKINSNNITMKGVNYPVLGISDTGDTQMMYPNGEYQYDGSTVTEYPMAKNGSLVALNQLTNFTNYNTPQPGGWLDKYN